MQEQEVQVTRSDDPREVGRNRNLWIVLAFALILACACLVVVIVLVGSSLWFTRSETLLPDFQYEATVERAVDVSPGTRLRVDNFAGPIRVGTAGDGQIRIVAAKHGPAGANLERIQVDIQQRGDTLLVRTERPRGLSNLYVGLEILAPPDTPLDLHTGSGNVAVEGFHAGLTAETGSGSITAGGLAGDVALNTGSGGVDARDINGSLAIDSGSGSLAVQGLNGDLEAHTGSGSIHVLGANGSARLETGSGTLEYEGQPRGECRFETGTGSIVLRLPAELDFQILADTGSGMVDVQFTVEGRISRQHVEGVVGTGQEAIIIASTGSGSISVFSD